MADLDAGTLVYNIKHADFGAVVDGSTDDTSAIQDAIDAAAAAGGGIVFHPGGIAMATQIRLKSRVILAGVGWGATFKQVASTSGHFIVLDGSSVEHTGLRDRRIDGNKANQSTQNDGVIYDNNGGSFSFGDPVHRISNVLITDVGGTGLVTSAEARECKVSDVYVNGADKDGFFILGTDSVFERCTSGSAGLAGFRCRATNTRYIGCKAFGSGRVTASAGDGFIINGDRASLIGCEAQDNQRHGFVLFEVMHCVLSGCDADSNGVNFGNGFRLDNADHNVVENCSAYNRPGKSTQSYGYEFANSPAGNRVSGVADSNASGNSTGSTAGNTVSIT